MKKIVLTSILVLSAATNVFAGKNTITELSVTKIAGKSAEKYTQDYLKTKSQLEEAEIRQRKVMSALFSLNRRIKKLVSTKSRLEQEKMGLDSNTKYLAEKISELEVKMKEQKVQVRERLVVIYKLGGQGLLRLLFSSGSSAQLERNLKILGGIAKKDMELIHQYQANLDDLGRKKTKLDSRLAHLVKVTKEHADNESKLVADMNLKSKILQKIKDSQKLSIKKLALIKEKTKDSGLFDSLFAEAFYDQKGKLKSPVKGSVGQRYGLIQDTENEIAVQHKGVFFNSPKGSEVKSVFSGKVAYADNIEGYGNTVIVDHGDHYFTVYGNLSQIVLSEGDDVEKEQIVAFSGHDPMREEEGLYFEVRHFSEPTNPIPWMKDAQ